MSRLHEFAYDPTRRVLRCSLKGCIADERIAEFYELTSRYIARINPLAGIVDLSGVESFEVSSQMIHKLAALPPAFPDVNRLRVIVAPSAHIFGMSRMFQILTEGTRPMLRVVRTIEEAYAHLQVTESSFEPVELEID